MIKTVEEWKDIKFPATNSMQEMIKAKSWLFDSAKALHKWVIGEELSEEEFDKAISIASQHYVR